MKKACGDTVRMKVILATGELGSLVNVYKASMVSMMAGQSNTHFIHHVGVTFVAHIPHMFPHM